LNRAFICKEAVYFWIAMLHNAIGIDEQTVARREEGCLIQNRQKIL